MKEGGLPALSFLLATTSMLRQNQKGGAERKQEKGREEGGKGLSPTKGRPNLFLYQLLATPSIILDSTAR